MVLPGALGPWAPGSVTDCQTSDRAYREAGAQGGRAGRAEAEACPPPPPGSRVRRPPPTALPPADPGCPACAGGQESPASAPPAPPAPPYPPLLRFLRGSCAPRPRVTSGRRADSFRSRGGRRPRVSGTGKGGSRRDGCRGWPNPVGAPDAPSGAGRAGPGARRGGGRRERQKEAEARAPGRRLLAPWKPASVTIVQRPTFPAPALPSPPGGPGSGGGSGRGAGVRGGSSGFTVTGTKTEIN